jgi:(5-formylfuran-3-yl)methyl phosphate synthase
MTSLGYEDGQQQPDNNGRGARPRLLVSVRDADEAEEALAGRADWIDLKEPRQGALGALDADAARSAVTCIAGRAPVSAAAGELVDWPRGTSRELLAVDGVSLLKLGLAGCRGVDWQTRWRQAQRDVAAAGKQLVAVAYADCRAACAPPLSAVLDLAAGASCPWMLLDTFDKRGGPLDDHISPQELTSWLTAARSANCRTAVAGRLDRAAIRRLPRDLVDVVAVRGAVCDGPRHARVDRSRVAELATILSRWPRTTAAAGMRGTGGLGPLRHF